MQPDYDRKFFTEQAGGSYRSAQLVLPLVFEQFHPHSVVDLGCGLGGWLKAARELGAQRILGIDGDYVDAAQLMIGKADFLPRDLTRAVELDERFDLAMSLEVAEHLPAEAAADHVASLTRLSDLVLFSAAIPAQGGVGHVNENWLEYWALRFAERGYLPIDSIRPRIWYKRFVELWYRQNTVLFASADAIAKHRLEGEVVAPGALMSMVHPEVFMLLLGLNKVVPFDRRHLDQYYRTAAEAATRMRTVGRDLTQH